MMKLHPTHIENIARKNLSFFLLMNIALTELLLDYEDLKDLREAKAESKNETPVSLDEVIHELGL